jgi:hypothetical protein
MPQIPLLTGHGKETLSHIELIALSPDLVQLKIDIDFAGRDVDEEISSEAVKKIGGPEAFRFDDLLGIHFETDGEQINGMVGAGSGNVKFILKRSDWNAAVALL